MLHAKPAPGLRARALPALLLSASAAAFGGLVVLAPEKAPGVLAYANIPVTELDAEDAAARDARASRSGRIDVAETLAREGSEAAAKAQAKTEAAAKAKAAAERAAAAKEKAAEEKAAEAAAASRAALRISGNCPVPSATFTDTWGAPRSGGRSHRGTDLMARYSAPVYAVADGTVRTASSSAGGISLYLHATNGEVYFYAHNSKNIASNGERVEAGELIARVGTSGNAPSSAPHVHFEREVDGRSINPYPFLRRIC